MDIKAAVIKAPLKDMRGWDMSCRSRRMIFRGNKLGKMHQIIAV